MKEPTIPALFHYFVSLLYFFTIKLPRNKVCELHIGGVFFLLLLLLVSSCVILLVFITTSSDLY